MSTNEIRRLALELDPIVHTDDWGEIRLSFAVDSDGWAGAYDRFPEVRRFLDRLGAMVAEMSDTRYSAAMAMSGRIRRERDDAREAGKALQEYSRKQRARIEEALALCDEVAIEGVPGVADRFRAALTGEEEK